LKKYLFFFIISIVFGCNYFNSSEEKIAINSPYKNLQPEAKYVGMNTCKGCHQDIYNTFIETGMGKSWNLATPHKSSARFGVHEVVYDTLNDLYYHPYWKNDSLMIVEYRLNGKDTIHQRIEKVKYIVGSGQHTNSHIMESNGLLYQAPITYYTQLQKWSLAPGFGGGHNSRFTRIVGNECITCHNFFPETDFSAENYFEKVPDGIQCERCHGAGSIHVDEKQHGKLVDISKDIDYSIVNPKKLKRDLQISLCQRCHLQGVTVLNEGKTFYDFKPGMNLSDVMHTFIPRYTDSVTNFIMASHADRMKMSKCFAKSEMTCITCHNPHVSVKFTAAETFNNACKKCHSTPSLKERAGVRLCSLTIAERKKENDNCSKCHMPMSGSIDIPNVKIHDHYIRKPEKLNALKVNSIRQFVRLACVSDAHPNALTKAKAYLNYFEEYESGFPTLLDSANRFLKLVKDKSSNDFHFAMIRYLFLKENYQAIIDYTVTNFNQETTKDAWTNYRVGEAFSKFNQHEKALLFLEKSIIQKPKEIDFLNKYAQCLFKNNKMNEAENVYQNILKLNKNNITALTDLGYLMTLNGKLNLAETYYVKAIALNPDYEQALMNLAALYNLQHQKPKAIELLKRVLKRNKTNKDAKLRLDQIQKF
jgi:hypothetical protein